MAKQDPEPLIHRAARLGDLAELQLLLADGVDLNERADLDNRNAFLGGLTALMVAARSDDGASWQTLDWLIRHGADLHAKSHAGVTAAWYAAGNGGRLQRPKSIENAEGAARLRYLLDAGLDPNEGSGTGRSLLTEACSVGDPERVALLLARNARVDPPVDMDQVRFRRELRYEEFRRLGRESGAPEERIEAEFKRYFPEPKGHLSSSQIPLFCASESGSAECVQLILAGGADPDSRDLLDHTPLVVARSPEVARALINHGADINAVDSLGEDVMNLILRDHERFEADAHTWSAVASELVKAGADIERRNKYGWTRLCLAVFRGHRGAVAWLLENGAQPFATIDDGQIAIHLVGWNSSTPDGNGISRSDEAAILDLLVEAGVNVNTEDSNGVAPLHIAVSSYAHGHCSSDGANPTAAAALLRHGADPNICDIFGFTPLMTAVNGFPLDQEGLECVRLLLANGADPCRQTPDGRTVLQLAIESLEGFSDKPKTATEGIQLLKEAVARAERP